MLITENWFLYRLIKHDELEKFNRVYEKVEDEEIIKKVENVDEDVDKKKLKNFINGVGQDYGSDISEEYIREKNNFQGLNQDWFDKYHL